MPTFARTRRQPRHVLAAGTALLGVSLLLVYVSATRGVPGAESLRSTAVSAAMPVVDAGSGLSQWTATTWSGLAGAHALREENARLERDLAAERLARAESETRAMEWRDAAALVESLPDFAPQVRTARVVAPVLDARHQRLWINLGSEHGLRTGQAVLGPRGLIGSVKEVHPRNALVQLLTDRDSRWGAEAIERSESGIVHGSGDRTRVEFRLEKTTTTVQPGDWVKTSGTRGSLVPSGIPIGEVVALEQDHRGERHAVLALPDDPLDLRHVFVDRKSVV